MKYIEKLGKKGNKQDMQTITFLESAQRLEYINPAKGIGVILVVID